MVFANIKMIRIINLWSIVESQTWPEFYRYEWRLNLNSSWTEGHTSQLSSNWTELIWSWITCIRVDRFFKREPARVEKSGRLRYVRTKSWIQNRPKIMLQSHRIFVNPSNPCTGSYFLTSYLTFFVSILIYLKCSPPCPPHSSVSWRVPHVAAARCHGEKVGSSEKPLFFGDWTNFTKTSVVGWSDSVLQDCKFICQMTYQCENVYQVFMFHSFSILAKETTEHIFQGRLLWNMQTLQTQVSCGACHHQTPDSRCI